MDSTGLGVIVACYKRFIS
ncbi:hypothetical protein [Ureibacillus acetophenoni]